MDAFTQRYFEGKVPDVKSFNSLDRKLIKFLEEAPENIGKSIDSFQIRQAVKETMDLARFTNKYFNDKARLKINYRFDLKIIGLTRSGKPLKIEKGQNFWSLQVSNVGNRKIKIVQIGVFFKKRAKRRKKGGILTRDYSGPINKFTLAPGDSRSFTIDYKLIHPKDVRLLTIMDAIRKAHKKRLKYTDSKL